eukprot:SM000042S15277  [mRNA]  locus=s42:148:3666:+ [translate_table: standard]
MEALVESARSNAKRYLSLLADAVDDLLPQPTVELVEEDICDVLLRQRTADNPDAAGGQDPLNQLPSELRRRFEVRLRPPALEKPRALREIRAEHIGHLVTVKGIVTRCSDVKPLLQVATYTCDDCGFEIYQEVTSRTFTPLAECPTGRCRTNYSKGSLHLQTRASKFMKFQEAKIQELADQVPKGHIPRSMTVHIRGELTRKVSPGDVVSVAGIFLPVPCTGFKAMRAGLTADTFLEAMSVSHYKKREQEKSENSEVEEAILRLAEEGDVYSRLARSIAPEIFGHEDVKKALLLLLVGAPTRCLPDGMKIRGDVHVCLMGDPGVAKSQLLKHIVGVAPRGIYTTGRGSSGVGLTAAVTRDIATREMILEGGALTVSIAKAGITTTLHARTAVLAAANPAWGRYDMRRTPAENINLPPALLSRFDIMFLILDRADLDADIALARHVLHVHQHSAPPTLDFEPLDATTLRAYVAAAQRHRPSVPRELTDYIAAAYAALRQEEAQSDAPHSYTTARTLLSILRLSEALARLRMAEEVAQSDVDEALRLMHASKASLYGDEQARTALDAVSDIYTIIRDEALRSHALDVSYADALNWVSRKAYTEAQLKECLEEYAALNVWQIHPTTLAIHFLDA